MYIRFNLPRYFPFQEYNTVFFNRILDTRTFIKLRYPLRVLFDNIPGTSLSQRGRHPNQKHGTLSLMQNFDSHIYLPRY